MNQSVCLLIILECTEERHTLEELLPLRLEASFVAISVQFKLMGLQPYVQFTLQEFEVRMCTRVSLCSKLTCTLHAIAWECVYHASSSSDS